MTAKELLDRGRRALERAGVPEPETDARYLLEAAAGWNRSDLYLHPERQADGDVLHAYLVLLERRCAREPLQHILGYTEFMGLTFLTDGRTLIPRQDTETLAELALAEAKRRQARSLLDLCTGSGCLAVTMAHYGDFQRVDGADLSEEALAAAAANAERNQTEVHFIRSDMFQGLTGRTYDMILSNPPYIRTGELAQLMPEVRDYDPRMALDGGPDGLDFYRIIAAEAPAHLTPGGILLLEIGWDQAAPVSALLEAAGFEAVRIHRDLCGKDRVAAAEKGDM